MSKHFDRTLIAATATLAFSVTAHAVEFNIPPQPLETALLAFSEQANVQVTVAAAEITSLRTTGIKADTTPTEALRALLENTSLTYKLIGERTYSVTSIKTPTNETSATTSDPSSVRLSQSDSPSASEGDDPARFPERIELEEIVVTGSHIRGTEAAGSKPMVITRLDIEQSAYGRLQDAFELLTQNFSGVSEDVSPSLLGNMNRGTEVQLRGLGPGTTLTLVNGQRPAGGGSFGGFTDISSIPVSAIERVEVLPDGASAIYGSDAIGGVVNIILREDFDGAETRVRLGTAGGEADGTEVAQLFGRRWSSGNAMFGYQFSQRDALANADRPYSAEGGDMRRFGGTDLRSLPDYASPGNIVNPVTRRAEFGIPTGQDGTNLSASDLTSTLNERDNSYQSLFPEQKMHSVFMSASQALGERVSFMMDARFSERDMLFTLAGPVADVVVPSSNPFYVNPFGGTGPVTVRYDFTNDLGRATQRGTTRTLMSNMSLRWRPGGDWQVALQGSYGREATDWIYRNGALVFAALSTVLADSNPQTALNVFGDGTYEQNPDTLDAIRQPAQYQNAVTTVWSAGVVADGPVLELPAGSARVAIGADYRDDRLADVTSTFNNIPETSSGRNVSAAFFELNVPLLGEPQAIPGVQQLKLSVAGRHDHYSDFGSTFNPKVGLGWQVFDQLTLRGTWGESFRAPPFYLSNPDIRRASVSRSTVQDPASPTGTSRVVALNGTQSGLQPETAEVWTAGIDFTPLERSSLSLTYFNIDYRDKIQTPGSVANVLVFEDRFAGTGVVTRNPTQAQVDAICASVVPAVNCNETFAAFVDLRQRNLAVVEVSGVDLQLNTGLVTSIGAFGFGISGTYTLNYDQAITQLSPTVDLVDTYSNPIALRLRGSISWSHRGWTANAGVNYAGSYDDNRTPARPIDAWTTVDLGVRYSFDSARGWLSDTDLSFNASNVFDELPPFVNVVNGYDVANGNVIGRALSVQLVKAW